MVTVESGARSLDDEAVGQRPKEHCNCLKFYGLIFHEKPLGRDGTDDSVGTKKEDAHRGASIHKPGSDKSAILASVLKGIEEKVLYRAHDLGSA